ncbi:uncharacterized protein Z519_07798 [Cladophialophora bantiana CBS 173.52]|uniref:Uncharacterized protein n=1 Tax=Cladophialophora bantiana (strain ATCC 10958 / CBS 173.52 / CDC B-1940 / NIH 8579) TaxID=1442370 RepID=A0A0D2HEX7_CLAB1|nr:uncharacterized protein Z519_07798 [Cladophialophora bantiana CBS 173.52]KIW91828.1 hypothetical protein Z519_07798 [Cladophialophora bantiana CBS 173.52]
MVSFTTALLSLLPLAASLAGATPIEKRQTSTTVSATFIGAADAQYTLQIPANSEWFPTDNPLSISHIQTSAGASCAFFGVDGAVVVLPAAGGYVDVGPPQTIAGGVCGPFPGQNYGMW